MPYLVRQVLWFIAFVLGVIGFFAGMFAAVPAFGLLLMLPGLEYVTTGTYHAPQDSAQMAVMLGGGFLVAGAGIILLGTSISRMGMALGRGVFSGVFVTAGSFFGWVLYSYYPIMQENGHKDGIVILSLLVISCAIAAISPFLPDRRCTQ